MQTSTPARHDARGWRLPGVANLHSHAFQRAMAGLAERQTDPADSFWTWRETMYAIAGRFTPELLQAVATQLYVEMLEAGYTTVCEFHYLHHAPGGGPYAPATAMSDALIAAAAAAGIRLTLLPVLYMAGGFDGRPLSERQRRFGHDVESFLQLLDELRAREGPMLRIGCAFHSLRAVPPAAIRDVLAALPPASRIHLHIAEQTAEVQDCVAARGARPANGSSRLPGMGRPLCECPQASAVGRCLLLDFAEGLGPCRATTFVIASIRRWSKAGAGE